MIKSSWAFYLQIYLTLCTDSINVLVLIRKCAENNKEKVAKLCL